VKYRYYTCDVFTGSRFGGNQLAVLPEAKGISDRQMQQVAREFNFSETTFVLPAEQGKDRRVRIFTPTREIPFAGHPNVGTAFVLATIGAFGKIDAPRTVTFEEKAGPVPVSIRRQDGTFSCELTAPEGLSLGKTIPADLLATAVSLTPGDVVTTTHLPQVASVGLPFLMAELKDRAALGRARINATGARLVQIVVEQLGEGDRTPGYSPAPRAKCRRQICSSEGPGARPTTRIKATPRPGQSVR